MTSSLVRMWLGMMLAVGVSYAAWKGWEVYQEKEAEARFYQEYQRDKKAGPPIRDFTLTDQAGREFNSQSLKGRVWVASFFFTSCPQTCLQLNRQLAALQADFPDSSARYVSITCDPETDTPEALAKYGEFFHADPARWTFLTGDFKYSRRVANDIFNATLERATHSEYAFIIDRQGKLRGHFNATQPEEVEKMKQLLVELENEPAAEPAL